MKNIFIYILFHFQFTKYLRFYIHNIKMQRANFDALQFGIFV